MDSGRLEAAPTGAVHLDTVRALHQTVVSLRTALEISKNELKQLKEKYEQHSHCLDYADVIEKLTLENHILRRRIIDSDYEEKDPNAQNIKLEVTYSPRSHNIEEYTSSEVVIATATDRHSTIDELDPIPQESDENSNFCSNEKLNEIPEDLGEYSASPELNESVEKSPADEGNNNTEIGEISQISSLPKQTEESEPHQPSFKTKLELLSKFDVRIKVRTLKEGTIISSTTSDSDSSEDRKAFEKESTVFKTGQHFHEKEEQLDDNKTVNIKSYSTDNVRMAVPNEADVKSKTDKFDVQVRITSEENLVVKENVERTRRKDTLNLDVDDLSLRSMSEGDNSVFSEGGTTPMDPNAAAVGDEKQEDNASGNESEEVDDIELIFTTDESKDMSNLQEDLVSIREGDQWAPQSASTAQSTPVLIKFHTLDPDFQPGPEAKDPSENQENTDQPPPMEISKQKRVSLPNDKEIRHVAFNGKGSLDLPGRSILKSCDNRSDNMLYRKSPNTSTRRLDSIDSLTCEYNRGLSFDNTKSSSFELGSSMDILHREESVDSFHRNIHLGHRYSVFAETDISKCGTSEDDLAANLNVRRNTCPNPFQYRPSNYRGVSRPPGPFKAGSARVRPVLRDSAYARRDSGAQTDVCALPPRWSSDGYLAHKIPVPTSSAATVAPRGASGPRRLTVPDARPPPPARRTDETRRVLLSDIGNCYCTLGTSATSSAATVAPRGASGPRRLTVPDARPPPPARRTDETRRVLLSDIGNCYCTLGTSATSSAATVAPRGASGPRRLTVPDARPPPPARRTDETRRVLLSDIGNCYCTLGTSATSSAATVAPRGASGPRRLTVPDARPPPPARRTDETRRVLLSDIGFTSMVPELSRSADPVWALSKRPSHPDDSTTTSTSKFLSRGSSYRSPCLSIDRSNDWTPQHVYLPRDSSRPWRSSLPDVRRDDTDELLEEAEIFVRRSIDNLQAPSIDLEKAIGVTGTPYIPAEPRHLRLGHTVKVITPHGRIAVGRVRYVGVAGGSAATSSVVVGTEVLHTQQPGLPRNDGLHRGRRYFLAPPLYTALFVPFSKVVMAWTN